MCTQIHAMKPHMHHLDIIEQLILDVTSHVIMRLILTIKQGAAWKEQQSLTRSHGKGKGSQLAVHMAL